MIHINFPLWSFINSHACVCFQWFQTWWQSVKINHLDHSLNNLIYQDIVLCSEYQHRSGKLFLLTSFNGIIVLQSITTWLCFEVDISGRFISFIVTWHITYFDKWKCNEEQYDEKLNLKCLQPLLPILFIMLKNSFIIMCTMN